MILSTRPDAATPVVAAPPPPTLMVTCLDQEPLPGVCARIASICGPPGRTFETTPENPAVPKNGLPRAFATSGRLTPTPACVSSVLPSRTCTSSTPDQPSAVVSTTQPLTPNGAPAAMFAPEAG